MRRRSAAGIALCAASFCVACLCAACLCAASLCATSGFCAAPGPAGQSAPAAASAGGQPKAVSNTASRAPEVHALDGPFTIETSIDRLPDELKAAFALLAGESRFQMASAGERYQATDVIDDLRLPFRRLVFAGLSADTSFIYYEKGGFAHSYALAVFSVVPGQKDKLLWGGPGFAAAKDLAELRRATAAGEYADGQAHSW